MDEEDEDNDENSLFKSKAVFFLIFKFNYILKDLFFFYLKNLLKIRIKNSRKLFKKILLI